MPDTWYTEDEETGDALWERGGEIVRVPASLAGTAGRYGTGMTAPMSDEEWQVLKEVVEGWKKSQC